MSLDLTDRKILNALQRDGRMQNIDLAREVGLSPSPCLRRVKQLEQTGVIKGYVALIDGAKVQRNVTIFTRVWLTRQDAETVDHFAAEIMKLPEVVECHLMAGECDYLLRVITASLDDYRQLQINHLTRIRGVSSIKTDIPMQCYKQTTELPLL